MLRTFINLSLLATAATFITAQDSGEGFIFQCDKPGVFALTFDDGPSEYTGTLLATLKEKQIKATFFSVGTQAAKAGISKYLKQAYEEGHQIASHTNTHADLNQLTASQIRSQMELTEKAIQDATGLVPAVMRPPYGNCNQQCREVMKEMGYLVVQWNVDSDDWRLMDTPDKWDDLVTNIVSEVEKSNTQTQSFISLQHDIHKFSVERTATIIDSIKAKSYKFETVNDCLSNRFPMYKNVANPQINQTTPSLVATVSKPSDATSTSVITSTTLSTSTSASHSVVSSSPAIDKASSAENHEDQKNSGILIDIPAFGMGLVVVPMIIQILL